MSVFICRCCLQPRCRLNRISHHHLRQPLLLVTELKWCQYSSSKDSSLWDSDLQDSGDKTLFYSFNDTNRQPSPSELSLTNCSSIQRPYVFA